MNNLYKKVMKTIIKNVDGCLSKYLNHLVGAQRRSIKKVKEAFDSEVFQHTQLH